MLQLRCARDKSNLLRLVALKSHNRSLGYIDYIYHHNPLQNVSTKRNKHFLKNTLLLEDGRVDANPADAKGRSICLVQNKYMCWSFHCPFLLFKSLPLADHFQSLAAFD